MEAEYPDGTLEALMNYPPSTKLAYRLLEEAGEPMTSGDLAAESLLAPRTARKTLRTLAGDGLAVNRETPPSNSFDTYEAAYDSLWEEARRMAGGEP